MLDVREVFDGFRSGGVSFFTGVPDSLLKDFCAYVTDHAGAGEHIIAQNEGGAVALAAGHYLATGEPALVYMQNSGFGNALNPLVSLADSEVYGLPMVVLVGWRGEPGRADEPQHVKQGRIMESLLDSLELPYDVIHSGTEDPGALIRLACDRARERQGPYVLLTRAGTFKKYSLRARPSVAFSLEREDAIQMVAENLTEPHVCVSTTGKASRELFELRVALGQGHARDFLTVGSMGHASLIALGIALRMPECPVYCLDGDGAALMHLGAIPIIGAEAGSNLKHIILNNGAHDSVGGQPTVALAMDLPAVALASGYAFAMTVDTREGLVEGLTLLGESDGPGLLEVRVNAGARSDLGRPTSTPIENRDALMKYLSHLDQRA